MFKLSSVYFMGNKASDYAIENNRLDYATLAKSFDAVLNNGIMSATEGMCGYWEQESGFIDNSEQIEELQEQIEELMNKITPETTEEQDNVIYDQIGELQEQIEKLQDEQENIPEVFQWFIVSDNGANILKECNEIVYYNDELDMYLWGITHFGTSWDYVLTDIPLNCGYKD